MSLSQHEINTDVLTSTKMASFILIFSHIFLKWLRSILQQPYTFIADHCSRHALRDPKEDCFRVACDHSYDKCSPSCDQLKSVMMEIESSLRSSKLRGEDSDDLMYTLEQAYRVIES